MIIKLYKTVFFRLLTCLFGLILTANASANEHYWQSPFDATDRVVTDQAYNRTLSLNTSTPVNDYSRIDYSQTEQISMQLNQSISDSSAYVMEYSRAEHQRHSMIGFTNNNLSVSFMKGEGEDFSELSGSYSNIDPYQFHAGLKQGFKYNGYAVDYSFGRYGHMQFGQANIQADGLLDRKASYVEWSNNRLFARATQFDRGTDSIGNGFDAGFAIGSNKQIAYQTMQLDNGASLSRIRLQLNGSHTRQYWVDLTSHRNPLFRDNDDQSIMFSFKTVLGANKFVNYAAEPTVSGTDEEGVEVKKSNTAFKRGLFIGVGVAAGVALASSGDDDRDNNTNRFALEREAAFDVLDRVNPLSVDENREYGGFVVMNQDGSFSPTETVTGDNSSVSIPGSLIPFGTTPTASIHTHAAFDPRFDNENFSPTDLRSDREGMLNGYLGTPGGQFKFHDYRTGQITTLGRVSN